MSPEALVGKPVISSSDVYSLGDLMFVAMEDCTQTFLTEPIRNLSYRCTQWNPTQRPSLTQVEHVINALLQQLTRKQLTQCLRYNKAKE